MRPKKQLELLVGLVVLTSCGDVARDHERVGTSRAAVLSLNSAAFFGWNGYASTDLSFSEFAGGDFSISARFLAQWPSSYAGPIIVGSGTGADTFVLGAGDYRNTVEGFKLMLTIGTTSYEYAVPIGTETTTTETRYAQPTGWNHVAITRSGNTVRFFFNGRRVCFLGAPVGTCEATFPGGIAPKGTVRFGRGPVGQLINGRRAQFYGFVDDVAVFASALSSARVTELATATRLTGTEAGLLVGYSFDSASPGGGRLPPVLSRPVTFASLSTVSASGRTVVSEARDSAYDIQLLPLPFQNVTTQLPFPEGEEWRVDQPYGGTISHHGLAAFSFDFRKPDGGTCDQPVQVVASGGVVSVDEAGDPTTIDGPNYIHVRHTPELYSTYMHTRTNGFVTLFPAYPPSFFTNGGVMGIVVGTQLTKAGARVSDCHLHYSTSDSVFSDATAVTIPMAFSNYKVKTEFGWYDVARGVPQPGQVIKR